MSELRRAVTGGSGDAAGSTDGAVGASPNRSTIEGARRLAGGLECGVTGRGREQVAGMNPIHQRHVAGDDDTKGRETRGQQ